MTRLRLFISCAFVILLVLMSRQLTAQGAAEDYMRGWTRERVEHFSPNEGGGASAGAVGFTKWAVLN